MILTIGIFWTSGCRANTWSAQFFAEPTLEPIFVITAGEGFGLVSLGDSLDALIAVLGPPDETTPSTLDFAGVDLRCDGVPEFQRWFEVGLDVRVCEDVIDRMFFYFTSDRHFAFLGVTALGIGTNSTEFDVEAAYGAPESIFEMPQLGASPPSTRLEYDSQGVVFGFQGGGLAHILVKPPE